MPQKKPPVQPGASLPSCRQKGGQDPHFFLVNSLNISETKKLVTVPVTLTMIAFSISIHGRVNRVKKVPPNTPVLNEGSAICFF